MAIAISLPNRRHHHQGASAPLVVDLSTLLLSDVVLAVQVVLAVLFLPRDATARQPAAPHRQQGAHAAAPS